MWREPDSYDIVPTGRLKTKEKSYRWHNVVFAEMRCIAGHVFWSSHPTSVAAAKRMHEPVETTHRPENSIRKAIQSMAAGAPPLKRSRR